MNELKKLAEQRINELKQVIKEKEDKLRLAPEGKIHISGTSERPFYYFVEEGKRIYVKESQRHLVKPICQKEYDQKVLAEAKKELKILEKFQDRYREYSIESIYPALTPARQSFVTPIWIPDEEYIKQWEEKEYKGKTFADNTPEFYTNKGERVRSKSEILIANALQKHQIPYRYEYPLYLKQYGTIYPDFTVLNVRKRKEYLWEHMGMLDDENYRDYALDKITAYEKNGIFPGDNLILSHETLKTPINLKIIEKIIFQYLK